MSVQNWKVLYCDCEIYPHVCEVYERLDNKSADLTIEKLMKMMKWREMGDGSHLCKSCADAQTDRLKKKGE